MIVRPFDAEHDAEAVLHLWNQSMPPPYLIDRRLFEQNLLNSPHFRAEGAFVAVKNDMTIGFVSARMAQEPIGSQGLLPDRGWISIIFVHPGFRRQAVGTILLKAALAWMPGREILPGGDPDHFFPGVPESADEALHFLSKNHFAFGDGRAWDLSQDIRSWQVPNTLATVEAQAEVRIGPCQDDWVPQLYAFCEKTFPNRWFYDLKRRLRIEPDASDIIVARGDDGTIHGFSSTFQPGSVRLGPSVYWRQAMGPAYGGLGPIGVGPQWRGKGLGLALVYRSIEHVQSRGTQTMGVDWTVLLDFYRKAGFQPWLSYRLGKRPVSD